MPFPPPVHGASMVSQCISQIAELQETYHCDYVNLSPSRTISDIGKFSVAKIGRLVGLFAKTCWYLMSRRYEVVYLAITCHGGAFLKDFPYVMLSKLFCRKVLIHQHNKGMSMDSHRFPYKFLMPMAYRNTRVMLLSEYLYPDIAAVVKKEQICVCPNGIAVEEPRPGIADQMEVPHLFFLSNLTMTKGCVDLLKACRILKDRGLAFQCDFVGAGSKEIPAELFERLIREHDLEGVTVYHGPKYGEEKEKMWNQTAIFVFPTYKETFGLVLLEAMQHRIPVVATREGGIPDIVEYGKTGLACEPQNPESLADALETLLRDKDLRQSMGQRGYERFHQYFTQAHFERNFTDHIHKIVNE